MDGSNTDYSNDASGGVKIGDTSKDGAVEDDGADEDAIARDEAMANDSTVSNAGSSHVAEEANRAGMHFPPSELAPIHIEGSETPELDKS